MAKIGEGHVAAMGRLGLKELTHNLLPAFPPGGQVIEEPGLAGNPTQGEVAMSRDGPGSGPEQEAPAKLTMADMRSLAAEKAQQAEQQMDNAPQRQQEVEGLEM